MSDQLCVVKGIVHTHKNDVILNLYETQEKVFWKIVLIEKILFMQCVKTL